MKSAVKIWISEWGTPKYILTDRRRQYVSEKMRDFCKQIGIKQTFTSAYNPSGNGISEKINQRIGNGLRLQKGTNIKKAVERIEKTMNELYHFTLGYSPYNIARRLTEHPEDTQYREKIESRLVEENSKNMQKINSKRVNSSFEIGEEVFTKNPIRSSKLDHIPIMALCNN